MSWRHSSLIVLVLVVLLVGACGPLPTDSATPGESTAPTEQPAFGDTPAAATSAPATSAPGGPAAGPGEAVDPDDYHFLGAPDAPVTIVEYSDFQ
ncbi:MAG TPA: hypothetical protein VLC95_09415 [Anaerolineae bacterium]|jgi:protein-disulfide isomerase|nr:hypothetical protein [Anaerolineae bacterium]